MTTGEIRKYLHDLNNALNAAKINAFLLRRVHGAGLDREASEGLDAAIYDAEKLVSELHQRIHAEEEAAAMADKSAQQATS